MRTVKAWLLAWPLAMCLSVGNASAEFYAQILGGLNLVPKLEPDKSSAGFSGVEIDTWAGFAVGGTAGYRFRSGIRAEAEVTYRQNGAEALVTCSFFVCTEVGPNADLDGEISTVAIMANAIYDVRFGGWMTPYLGLGVGAVSVTFDQVRTEVSSSFPTIDGSDIGAAFQLIGGVSLRVEKNIDVVLDYRYIDTRKLSIETSAGSVNTDYTAHTFSVGAKYRF